jgi:hypothetical protein
MVSVLLPPQKFAGKGERVLIDLTTVAYDIILRNPVIAIFAISVINVIPYVVVKFYHTKYSNGDWHRGNEFPLAC